MKNTIIPIFLFSLLISSCSIHKLKKNGVYKDVSSEEYLVYVNDSSVNIIDVRSPKEYNRSHIEGAVNVSYFGGKFKENFNKLDLDTSRTTLIYCQTQHRSLMVANKIYKAGFHSIIDLDKGMRVWLKDEMPYVVGDSLK
jgi:rhodanese-related sulfurtransferase